MMNDNFNYIRYLISHYVKRSQCNDFFDQERKDLEIHILLEVFARFGYAYSSDDECDVL